VLGVPAALVGEVRRLRLASGPGAEQLEVFQHAPARSVNDVELVSKITTATIS
jgi:hypothetical protein